MTHLKIINASQGSIHKYEELRRRLNNCNASIYFNKQCIKRQLTPNYANIKVPNTSPAHKHTQRKIPAIRIKDEIKFLYSKKQQLNLQTYYLHLTLANTSDRQWPHIRGIIEEKLNKEAKTKYINLDHKLDRLTQTQKKTPHNPHTFYHRLVNNTDIHFSKSETSLLQKGLKYNLQQKPKNWLQNLALEAETAITKLPPNEIEVYRKLTANRIDTLQKQQPSHHKHPEMRTMQSIRTKLLENKATVTRADKGNSIVILPTLQYENKIETF
jgi:hypothetical protein